MEPSWPGWQEQNGVGGAGEAISPPVWGVGVGIKSSGELENEGDITEDSPPFCPRPCSEDGETEETRERARWGLGAGRGQRAAVTRGAL